MSTLLYKKFNFKRTFAAPTFVRRKYLSPYVKRNIVAICDQNNLLVTRLLDLLILSLLREPWALANEIMLNIMQNFDFDFLENEFWQTGVYVLSSVSRTLHNFSKGLFSMYRGILELKSDTSILHKNGSFANMIRCRLTALLVKTKIYIFFNNQQHEIKINRFLCVKQIKSSFFSNS